MGTLSFGLVSVPVKLYSAVTRKTVHFHQIHTLDSGRIHQKHVCALDGEEIPLSEIVKGYEIAPDRYVPVEARELAALEPLFTRTIQVEDFVDLEEIDPIYFDHPYHVVPGVGGSHPYQLLLSAMRDTGKVAIGRIVMRSKERLVAIRPRENALLMLTMSYGDEVNPTTGLRELEGIDEHELDERELQVARRLVASISEPFDIDKYQDTFREAVLDLVDRKAAGEPLPLDAQAEPPPESPDLMEALEASLEQVASG
ncbi:MAG TPA: Ku protein [Solirubrobacteraceae bacterium]|nr:Ku protein [Solirubrobacteraceae bacterium]